MTVEETGRYFGYPECCITWFVERREKPFPKMTPLTAKQALVHGYRGFIPCPSCAEKVTIDTIDTLITNRQCPTPFPDEGE